MPPLAIGMAAAGALGGAMDARRARRENARGTRENITETQTPWGPSIDYRTGLMEDARNQGQQGPMPWNVPRYNYGPSGEIQQRGDDLWNRALQGSDLENQAQGFAGSLLSGQDPNPYRRQAFDAAQGYRGPQELFQMLNQELGGFGADRWSAYNDPFLGNTQQQSSSSVPSLGGRNQPQMPQPQAGGGKYGAGFAQALASGDQNEIQRRLAQAQKQADKGNPEAAARLQAMQAALNPQSQAQGGGQASRPGGGGYQGGAQAPRPQNTRMAYYDNPQSAGGGQGGGGGQRLGPDQGAGAFGQAGFSGEIGDMLRNIAQGGGPYAEQIQQFISQAGQNPFLSQTQQAIDKFQTNPFIGKTNEAIAALGNNQYQGTIDDILGGKYLSGNPQADAMIEMEQRRLTDQFNSQLMPNIDQQAEAYGRFRGGEAAKAQAMGGLANALGDIGTQFRFQDYNARMGDVMNTLGMGLQSRASDQSQLANLIGQGGQLHGQDQAQLANLLGMGGQMYDTSMGQAQNALGMGIEQMMGALGMGNQRDIANMGDLTQRYGINSSAATARAGQSAAAANAAAGRQFQGEQAARDRALQQRLSEQGMLMNLVGGIGNAEQFGMGMMGDIGSDYGQNQMGALGMAGQLGNADFGRMMDAFGANFGVDQMRQRGAEDAYGQSLDRFQYQSQAPWQDLLNQANIFNAMSGGYGTTNRQGTTVTPYTGPSTIGGGISGGLGALGLFGGMGGKLPGMGGG